jgi:uncharacterized membrane protein HdeD (DUF308 family)
MMNPVPIASNDMKTNDGDVEKLASISADKNDVVATQEDLDNLQKWNLYLGIFHLITGIIIFIITDTTATVPSYSFFPTAGNRSSNFWVPVPKLLSKVIVGYFPGVFLLLAGVDHMVCATFGRATYEEQLANNQNHFRWAEYSISASLMHIMVAYLSGMFDVHLIFAVFGLTLITMVFGSEQERTNAHLQGKPELKSMRPFWFGCIPHVWNWAIICCFFFVGVSRGNPPAFVWAIIFFILILDSTFAINMYLQQIEYGKWKKYVYGEWVFCVLSLVAKQLLAWVNFGGTRSLR